MAHQLLPEKVLTDPKKMLDRIIGRQGCELEVGKICEQHPDVVGWLLARIEGVNELRERDGRPPAHEKYACAARLALTTINLAP